MNALLHIYPRLGGGGSKQEYPRYQKRGEKSLTIIIILEMKTGCFWWGPNHHLPTSVMHLSTWLECTGSNQLCCWPNRHNCSGPTEGWYLSRDICTVQSDAWLMKQNITYLTLSIRKDAVLTIRHDCRWQVFFPPESQIKRGRTKAAVLLLLF